jgi:hypothetical protein
MIFVVKMTGTIDTQYGQTAELLLTILKTSQAKPIQAKPQF